MQVTVSVVIVSRDRPDALRRCLLGVTQQLHDAFEIIIVADPAGCAALRGVPQAAHCKIVEFDDSNISAARNLGIAQAAGDVVAFVDDDAVPEPTWLRFLSAPFSDPEVAAAVGYVRGRNGISWQSRGVVVDGCGRETPLDLSPDHATVLKGHPGKAVKTTGTNMAFRRSVLAQAGGFDPRYRFFLDETDLNLRLAAQGICTAITPRAQVHHGYAASARRRADRVPVDLFEIGASWAMFLDRHCDADQHGVAWDRIRQAERRRALVHLQSGGLEPRDVRRLMRSLQAGYADGAARAPAPLPPIARSGQAFAPYPRAETVRSLFLSGRIWSRHALIQRARDEVAAGHIVSVLRLSPTALYHRVRFTRDGIWEQTGGLFGKSRRSQPLFSLWSFARRSRAERNRIAETRGLPPA